MSFPSGAGLLVSLPVQEACNLEQHPLPELQHRDCMGMEWPDLFSLSLLHLLLPLPQARELVPNALLPHLTLRGMRVERMVSRGRGSQVGKLGHVGS